jgi:hypothetical protein
MPQHILHPGEVLMLRCPRNMRKRTKFNPPRFFFIFQFSDRNSVCAWKWRRRRGIIIYGIPVYKSQQDAHVTEFILSENFSTCFGFHYHPSHHGTRHRWTKPLISVGHRQHAYVSNHMKTKTPPTTHTHQFQLLHDSSRQQYGYVHHYSIELIALFCRIYIIHQL